MIKNQRLRSKVSSWIESSSRRPLPWWCKNYLIIITKPKLVEMAFWDLTRVKLCMCEKRRAIVDIANRRSICDGGGICYKGKLPNCKKLPAPVDIAKILLIRRICKMYSNLQKGQMRIIWVKEMNFPHFWKIF